MFEDFNDAKRQVFEAVRKAVHLYAADNYINAVHVHGEHNDTFIDVYVGKFGDYNHKEKFIRITVGTKELNNRE